MLSRVNTFCFYFSKTLGPIFGPLCTRGLLRSLFLSHQMSNYKPNFDFEIYACASFVVIIGVDYLCKHNYDSFFKKFDQILHFTFLQILLEESLRAYLSEG